MKFFLYFLNFCKIFSYIFQTSVLCLEFFCVDLNHLLCSRFLQGAETDPEEIAKIRQALAGGTSYCGRVLNYKKDGTQFWNLLTIAPIKDEAGNVLKYIG